MQTLRGKTPTKNSNRKEGPEKKNSNQNYVFFVNFVVCSSLISDPPEQCKVFRKWALQADQGDAFRLKIHVK